MKILFILPRYHTNQYFWTKTLKEHGHEIHYLVAEKTPLENYSLTEPFAVEHKPLPKWLQIILSWYMKTFTGKVRHQFLSLPNRRILNEKLKEINPDLVVIREVSYPLSFFSFWECKKLRIPTLRYTQHQLELPERFLTKTLQTLKIVPNISITPTRKNPLNTVNQRSGAHYVPLITDFKFVDTDKTYYKDNLVRLLFIGKFVSVRKNHLLLLKAMNQIKTKLNFRLTMVGESRSNDSEYISILRKFLRDNDLESEVEILTNIEHNAMSDIYKKSDLFILPSAQEAFSISTIEAMNYALPVIVTDTNGTQYCVENGINGYVVKTGDIEDLKKKILLVAKDANTLKYLGHNAFVHHQKEHSPEIMYKKFMQVISKVQ